MIQLHAPERRTEPVRSSQVWSVEPAGEVTRAPHGIWGALRRNVALIFACMAFAATAAVLTVMRRTPVYEAMTSIRVDEKQAGVPALEILQGLTSGNEVSTEQEMLSSRSVAEDVVDSLGLQFKLVRPALSRDTFFSRIRVPRTAPYSRYRLVKGSGTTPSRIVVRDTLATVLSTATPAQPVRLAGVEFVLNPSAEAYDVVDFDVVPFEDAVDDLRTGITIDRPNRDVNIVDVRYRGTDPALVQAIPNVIAARFIARRQEAKQEGTRATVSFLRDQSANLAKQLRSAENALRAFRESQGIVSLPDQARTQISRVAELQAQRGSLEIERSALARLVATAQRTAANQKPGQPSPYREMLAFPTLLRNQAASQLLASLTAVEDHRVELISRRSARDPDVQLLTSRTAELEDQLRRITQTYLQALADEVASVDSTLAASQQRLGAVPYQEARLAQLQRDAKTLEEIYGVVQSRLKEAEIAVGVADGSVRVVDQAVMPRAPVEPQPRRALALALALGLMLGTAAAFAREFLDKSIHSRGDVRSVTGLPVLGILPAMQPADRLTAALRRIGLQFLPRSLRRVSSAVSLHAEAVAVRPEPAWGTAREAFNGLYAELLVATTAPMRTLVVTSPMPGDGKTTVAVNLAATIARKAQKVLFIDGDMRRGVIHRVLRLPRAPGLSDVLFGASDLGGALRTVQVAPGRTLHVLTSGSLPREPGEAFGPALLDVFLSHVATEFDWVIIDTPPLNVVADAALLSGRGAAVLLVARAGVTSADALGYAVEKLHGVRAAMVGAVLNGIDKREASYDTIYPYYEAYAAHYHAEPAVIAAASGSRSG